MSKPVEPDREDFETVYREHGKPPANATDKELADLDWLAQAQKLIRLTGLSED
jgi:hypothetical protein